MYVTYATLSSCFIISTLNHGNWPIVAKAIVTAGLTCAQDIGPIEKIITTTVNPAVAAYSRRPTAPFWNCVLAVIPHTQNIKIKVPTNSAITYIHIKITCTSHNIYQTIHYNNLLFQGKIIGTIFGSSLNSFVASTGLYLMFMILGTYPSLISNGPNQIVTSHSIHCYSLQFWPSLHI